MAQKRRVLVLGAGLAGVESALNLAEAGVEVVLIEKEPHLGGHALKIGCKAAPDCQSCHGCLTAETFGRLAEADLRVLTNTTLTSLVKANGAWKAKIKTAPAAKEAAGQAPPFPWALPRQAVQKTQEEEIDCSAVIVATGFQVAGAEHRSAIGYGEFANVTTAWEVEQQLLRESRITRPSDGAEPKRAAFIQCVGSRDHEGGACSRVCCGYAMRLGRWLTARQGAEVTIFYMDLQNASHNFEELLALARAELRFIRAIPGHAWPKEGGAVALRYSTEGGGPALEEEFDLVVLSVGLNPGEKSEELAGLAGLTLNERGFLTDSPKVGLFAAGAATGPMDMAEVLTQARRKALACLDFMARS